MKIKGKVRLNKIALDRLMSVKSPLGLIIQRLLNG